MAAETNVIKKADIVSAREIDFATRFNASAKKLLEMLGVSTMIPKAAGTMLTVKTASGTLQSGSVAEGDIIPLSKYTVASVPIGTIELRKWRKATTAEAIIEDGYELAVGKTTDKMLHDAQSAIRTSFVSGLATGTGAATGVGLQATIAQAWAQLQVKFEDDEIESVYFINPLDAADYLASAQISTQTAFGMTYIENFMAMGTAIISGAVPKGKLYATAKENLIVYYIDVKGSDLGEVFDFTTDETGLVGIHEDADYVRMTAEDVVVSGMVITAERIDGVIVGTITAGA